MASTFKIVQYEQEIKRGIRFHFGGNFNYTVIIDCQLNGTWVNGFFTWSGTAPGQSAEAYVHNGETSFSLRGTYEKIGDSSVKGNFHFLPPSGTIPSNGFFDVDVTPV